MTHPSGRRSFLKTLAVGAGGLALEMGSPWAAHARSAAPALAAARADVLLPTTGAAVRLEGALGRHIDRCIAHRVAAQDAQVLLAPFRARAETWCWSGEFWGKWFLSAVEAYRYTGDAHLQSLLKDSVYELLATQTPEGYIGVYSDENQLAHWDVWSRKYTMLGLLAYHDVTQDDAVLDAIRQMADHLMLQVGPGAADIVRTGLYRGMASSSVLVPVVQLFERTGDERYLDFARYIIDAWSTPEGPQLVEKGLAHVPVADRFPAPERWWSWENGQKAYEMMSCYEGLLDLYRVTGEEAYRLAALSTWESIRDTEINIAGSGAGMECWYGGRLRQTEAVRHTMETCVTTTWMGLCANLLRLTGDPTFADEIERTAYNALLGSLTPDGGAFAKYSALAGTRRLGEEQCGSGLNCCVANGPRGLLLLPSVAVMASEEGPVVNLYETGRATVPLPGDGTVTIAQETEYPRADVVRFTVTPAEPGAFTLRLRIPRWSLQTRLSVNGQDQGPVEPGAYARLRRDWQPGDTVQLSLDLRGHAVFSPGPQHVHAAVVRGPIILARDRRLAGDAVDDTATPVTDADGFVELEPMEAPDDVWMAFRAPYRDGPHDDEGDLALCDYRSAGNTWSPESKMRVWMPQRYDPSRTTPSDVG